MREPINGQVTKNHMKLQFFRRQKAAEFWEKRMGILRAIAKDSLIRDEKSSKFRAYSTAAVHELLDGPNIFEMQDYWRNSRSLEAILESLVESKDLEPVEADKFRITPMGFKSLSDFELQQKQHRIAVCQSWLMLIFTFVIAIATAAGVCQNFFSK